MNNGPSHRLPGGAHPELRRTGFSGATASVNGGGTPHRRRDSASFLAMQAPALRLRESGLQLLQDTARAALGSTLGASSKCPASSSSSAKGSSNSLLQKVRVVRSGPDGTSLQSTVQGLRKRSVAEGSVPPLPFRGGIGSDRMDAQLRKQQEELSRPPPLEASSTTAPPAPAGEARDKRRKGEVPTATAESFHQVITSRKKHDVARPHAASQSNDPDDEGTICEAPPGQLEEELPPASTVEEAPSEADRPAKTDQPSATSSSRLLADEPHPSLKRSSRADVRHRDDFDDDDRKASAAALRQRIQDAAPDDASRRVLRRVLAPGTLGKRSRGNHASSGGFRSHGRDVCRVGLPVHEEDDDDDDTTDTKGPRGVVDASTHGCRRARQGAAPLPSDAAADQHYAPEADHADDEGSNDAVEAIVASPVGGRSPLVSGVRQRMLAVEAVRQRALTKHAGGSRRRGDRGGDPTHGFSNPLSVP